MLPSITIVTPSYNQGVFLEDTIRSVLSQEYPRLQYIVIDGGSTDNSRDIIRRHADRLDYWTSEPDTGQSSALNKGFSRATGELLGWVNSDDLLAPGALQLIGKYFEDNPGHIVAGDVAVFQDGADSLLRVIRQRHLTASRMIAGWTGKAVYSQPGVYFPRKAFVECGGIDESLHWVMDRDLMIRMLRRTDVAYIGQVVAYARLHPNAKTCAQAGRQVAEAYKVYQRYWRQLSDRHESWYRLASVYGLSRCLAGRLYHRDFSAVRPIVEQIAHIVRHQRISRFMRPEELSLPPGEKELSN
jgi:glycosyltransferase involved in cell wall biosynthesis